MSAPRGSLGRGVLLGAVAGLTTWVTLLTWADFAIANGEYLAPLLSLALVLGIGGSVLRWLRVPVAVVPLLQLLLTGLILVASFGGAGPLPSPAGIEGLLAALSESSETASRFAAPIPFGAPSVAPLLVGCGALAIIAVDLIACGLGRVPISGLALLMVYTLPVTIWGSAIAWWTFVLGAGGFLFMLFLREDERFDTWGRRLVANPDAVNAFGFSRRSGHVRGGAAAVGALATVAALLLPALVPTWGVSGLFAGGAGFGGGGRQIQIVNPMTDLRRDLRQGRDVPLLRVRTDEADPSYLRYTVLTTFTDSQWTPGDRQIPSDQVAQGQALPAPPGVSVSIPRKTYSATYSTDSRFRSRWLPVPSFPTTVTAEGDWRYDTSILDFVSGDDSSTDRLEYAATGAELELGADDLSGTLPADAAVRSRYTRLPSLPGIVTKLADEVTQGGETAFDKALALQDFFRSSGQFTYTLDAPTGNGTDDLATFLSAEGPDGRRGYCEQFASAMAVMARAVNIPARVAVGFLRPDRIGDTDTYVYSAHDLHAWPELYFQGAGWVRFEPTPPTRQGTAAPSYTENIGPDDDPSSSASTAPSESSQPSVAPSVAPRPEQLPEAGAAGAVQGGFPWVRVLGGLALLVVMALAGLGPRAVRRSRARRRLSEGTAEAAWAELRDSAIDLGQPWPDGRTPRATARVIADGFTAPGDVPRPLRGPHVDPDAAAALDRLVGAVERERYAPSPAAADAGTLAADVATVSDSLRRGTPVRVRRRADWLPASVVGSGLGVAARDDGATGGRPGSTGRGTREAAPGQAEELESADH